MDTPASLRSRGWFAIALAVALASLGACFSAPSADVQFACDPDTAPACPPGYSCEVDGCCHRNGSDVAASLGTCRLEADSVTATVSATDSTATDSTVTDSTVTDSTATDSTATDATATDATAGTTSSGSGTDTAGSATGSDPSSSGSATDTDPPPTGG